MRRYRGVQSNQAEAEELARQMVVQTSHEVELEAFRNNEEAVLQTPRHIICHDPREDQQFIENSRVCGLKMTTSWSPSDSYRRSPTDCVTLLPSAYALLYQHRMIQRCQLVKCQKILHLAGSNGAIYYYLRRFLDCSFFSRNFPSYCRTWGWPLLFRQNMNLYLLGEFYGNWIAIFCLL